MTPATTTTLTTDLRALGVAAGDTLMVHTSLRRLGRVVGGAQTALAALHEAVGADGTLVMPVQSWQLCDPQFLAEPDVPQEWWPLLRAELPAYDPARSPSQTMGAVAELFRTEPGVRRSGHPHRSIAAHGPHAQMITAVHDLDCPSGERSPLATLYELEARVLLLGVETDKATALHLAEHRAEWPGKRLVPNGGPILVDGVRTWRTWEELDVHDEDFLEVADAYSAAGGDRLVGTVGAATSQLLPMRPLVDFAAAWFTEHRSSTG